MNPWRALGNLPGAVWILFGATLVNRAGTMALPFLVLYLTRQLTVPIGDASLTLVIYGVGAFVAAPVSGKLCDRFAPSLVLKTSLFLSGTILLLFPLANSITTIWAITLIWSITSESFRPASMAILGNLLPQNQRKAGFALDRLAINLGMSIGPAAGGFLAVVSFPALFFVDGLTSILAGMVLVLGLSKVTRVTIHQPTGDDVATREKPGRSALADRRFLLFLAAMIPVEIVVFQTHAAMPLFTVRDLGMSESEFGLLLAINAVIIIFLEIPLNNLTLNWPHRRALALGSVLFGLGFGALAITRDFVTATATVVIWTFGEMILFPASSAFVADLSPVGRRGQYAGLYTMSFSTAFLVGPWIGAQVMERYGSTTLWIATLGCGLLSAIMMLRVGARSAVSVEPSE
jgi:predicted MFS family arabinose efflux permease